MTIDRIYKLLKEKEGIRLEFKVARSALPENLFDSVCSMLNREGGDILLGVTDKGEVVGVDPTYIDKMITDLVNLSNNPQKINPPFIVFPRKYLIGDHWIIHIQLPVSSQVHKTLQTIYDRSNDGDFKISGAQQIAEVFNRKRTHYTENTVYPALYFEHFKPELFPKIRNLIRSNNANHPWLALDDTRLLETAGLWRRDFHTGEEGYTQAAALLLGKDEVIRQILPHYKIDALVRIDDTNRYDDRLYIQTNLIDAYEQLMGFVEKHLPDKFYLQADQRISLRTAIFREVVANIIVHREYTNAHPCTFVIGKDNVETENANNPHGQGMIDPNRFTPFPKNPVIAKFFIELGRVDELGSGVLNVTRLSKQYAGRRKAKFIEGNTFKMVIPVLANAGDGVSEGVSEGLNEGVSDGLNRGVTMFKEPPVAYLTGNVNISIVTEVVNRLLDEGVNDGDVDGVTITTRMEIIQIMVIVLDKEGLKTIEISKKLQKSMATVERHIKRAKALNLLKFQGSPKSGGYYVTEYFENRLVKND
jgi:ATP-dependent DNA helicase RecG